MPESNFRREKFLKRRRIFVEFMDPMIHPVLGGLPPRNIATCFLNGEYPFRFPWNGGANIALCFLHGGDAMCKGATADAVGTEIADAGGSKV